MKKGIIFVLVSMLVLSCAVYAKKKKVDPPKWLGNPKSEYPENMYLSAIGEADSRSMAENMAAANLSKIFESNVKTDETYTQRYQELTKNGQTSYEDQSDVTKNVNIQSGQTLINLEFGDSYTNDMGRVFVIAYLNRMKTGQIYEEKINENAAKIEYYQKLSNESSDLLFKYAALGAAAAISTNNEILLDQLGIIFPSAKEMLQLNYNHTDIMKQSSAIAKQISFQVKIKNDEDKKITILVEELMNDLGFVLSHEYLLYVDGTVLFEDTDLQREEKFVRYELQLQVSDLYDNTILTLDTKGREGHISYPEARARAVRSVEKEIKKELKKKMISYFDSMVLKKS
ncbi:MAG: LPP20 family lipoprotein [Candidatus Cloacimonadales bacterium]|nr:LPP20 family lipoprotein [Candidatus Cloacimonadales bacterium]